MNRRESETRTLPTERNHRNSSIQYASSLSSQSSVNDNETPKMIFQVTRYLMFQVSCIYLWLIVFVILQLLMTMDVIKGTVYLAFPIFGLVFSQHILSFLAKPEFLKHQQNLPRVISWGVRILDIILAIFFVLGHDSNIENIKSLTFIFLGIGIVAIFISSFFEFFSHFDNTGPTKRAKSLVHLTSTGYKLFIHLQVIVLTSKLGKENKPQAYLIVGGPASTYLLSIPIFMAFALTTASMTLLCHRIIQIKALLSKSKRILFLGSIFAAIIGFVIAYLLCFSDLSSREYFKREKQSLFVALSCTLAIFSVSVISLVSFYQKSNNLIVPEVAAIAARSQIDIRMQPNVPLTTEIRADMNQEAQQNDLIFQRRYNEPSINPLRIEQNHNHPITTDFQSCRNRV